MLVQQKWHQHYIRQRNASNSSQTSTGSDEVLEFILIKENLDRKRKDRKTRERRQRQDKYLSEILEQSLEFDDVELSKIIPFEEEELVSS